MEDFSPGKYAPRGLTAGDEHLSPVIRSRTKSCRRASSPRARRPTGAPATVPCRPQRAPPASFRERAAVRVWPWEANCRAGCPSIQAARSSLMGPGQAGPGLQFRPAVAVPGGPEGLINGHRGPCLWSLDGPHGLKRISSPGPRKSPDESGPPGGQFPTKWAR